MRVSILAAVALSACASDPAAPMFECPAGTTRAGEVCMAAIDPGQTCVPACAEGSRCESGRCYPEGVPNVNGYWRGRLRVWCEAGDDEDSVDATIGWDIEQDGTSIIVREGDRVGEGTVGANGISFTYSRDFTATSYQLQLEGIVSYGATRIEARASGPHRFPELRANGSVATVICDAAPHSYVRLERQGRPPVDRPRPDVSGVWSGRADLVANCISRRTGILRAVDSPMTATISAPAAGIVTAEMSLEDAESRGSAIEGRLDAAGSVFFSRGTMYAPAGGLVEEIVVGAMTDPPARSGIDLYLSWDERVLLGEMRGLIVTSTRAFENPCSIVSGVLRWER